MKNKYRQFELHAPALVNLADHAHRNGLNTRAEVDADLALELAAMDTRRLERIAAEEEKHSQTTNTGGAIVELANNQDEQLDLTQVAFSSKI